MVTGKNGPGQYISEIALRDPLPGDSYLAGLPAVKHLVCGNALSLRSNVTFFVGENGTGKSTLTEAIAVAYGFNAEGGSRNFTFATMQTHSELWRYLTLSRHKYAKDGFFLRFEVEEIPEKKKNAVGVRGMKLSDGDEIEAVFYTRPGDETSVEYKSRTLVLNQLKPAHRDSKGTKVRA